MTERKWNSKVLDLLGDVHAVCGLLSMPTTEITIVDRDPESDRDFPFGKDDFGDLYRSASELLSGLDEQARDFCACQEASPVSPQSQRDDRPRRRDDAAEGSAGE